MQQKYDCADHNVGPENQPSNGFQRQGFLRKQAEKSHGKGADRDEEHSKQRETQPQNQRLNASSYLCPESALAMFRLDRGFAFFRFDLVAFDDFIGG